MINGNPIVPGAAEAVLILAREPLSFWGGYDPLTGEIIDRRHALSGQNAVGKVLAIPHTRGSSTSTAILLESVRTGKAPAALIISRPDPFLALAAVVADVQYGVTLPVIEVTTMEFASLVDGSWVRVEESGRISFGESP